MLLTVFSAVTAAALIRAFKRRWRRPLFWASFLGVMIVRTVFYVAVLRKLPDWPLALFGVVTMGEIPLLLTALYWLNYRVADAAR